MAGQAPKLLRRPGTFGNHHWPGALRILRVWSFNTLTLQRQSRPLSLLSLSPFLSTDHLDSRAFLYRTKSPFFQYSHFHIRHPAIYPWATPRGHRRSPPCSVQGRVSAPSGGRRFCSTAWLGSLHHISIPAKKEPLGAASSVRRLEQKLSVPSSGLGSLTGCGGAILLGIGILTSADTVLTGAGTHSFTRGPPHQRHLKFKILRHV